MRLSSTLSSCISKTSRLLLFSLSLAQVNVQANFCGLLIKLELINERGLTSTEASTLSCSAASLLPIFLKTERVQKYL